MWLLYGVHNYMIAMWTGGWTGTFFLASALWYLFYFYGTRTDLLPYWPTGAAVSLSLISKKKPPRPKTRGPHRKVRKTICP